MLWCFFNLLRSTRALFRTEYLSNRNFVNEINNNIIDVQLPRSSEHQNTPAFFAGNGFDETARCPDTWTDSFLARLICFTRARPLYELKSFLVHSYSSIPQFLRQQGLANSRMMLFLIDWLVGPFGKYLALVFTWENSKPFMISWEGKRFSGVSGFPNKQRPLIFLKSLATGR